MIFVWFALGLIALVGPIAYWIGQAASYGAFDRVPREQITPSSIQSADTAFYHDYIEKYVATGDEKYLEWSLKSLEPIENETVSF